MFTLFCNQSLNGCLSEDKLLSWVNTANLELRKGFRKTLTLEIVPCWNTCLEYSFLFYSWESRKMKTHAT